MARSGDFVFLSARLLAERTNSIYLKVLMDRGQNVAAALLGDTAFRETKEDFWRGF
jgi:hypothetical protein